MSGLFSSERKFDRLFFFPGQHILFLFIFLPKFTRKLKCENIPKNIRKCLMYGLMKN